MKKNLLEWCVFGLSVLLIVSLLGYLGVKAFSFKDTPPDLRANLSREQDKLNRNIYRIELVNHGEQTAENVAVEVTLLTPGAEDEKAEALFPMAPKKSKQKAWVTFKTKRQPNQKTEVHILGYNQP